MFCVIENRVYALAKNTSNKYPLVSISISSSGVVTIKDEGEGITTLPGTYKKLTLEEVIATFGITSEAGGGYKPFVDLGGYEPVTIYLDETNKAVTITAANPSAGVFSGTSSNTNVATVTNSDGVFTIVPVAEGSCAVTVKFDPTDTDFADTYCAIPVTVAKRQVVLEQQRDIHMVKSTSSPDVSSTATAVIKANVATPTVVAVSSDEDNVSVSVTDQTITITAADDKTGEATIKVYGTKTNADDSADMEFTVHVYAAASAAVSAAPSAFNIDKDDEAELTWTLPAGESIVEATSSDETHIQILGITAKNKVKVKAVAPSNGDQATITAYCQQRGKGQLASTVVGTVVVA
jgi:hypothetical protein